MSRMAGDEQKSGASGEALDREVEETLRDAKIVARWSKKPFYIV